jgi:hypothetical protein
LNDDDLNSLAAEHGKDMSIKTAYVDYLAGLSSTRCRPMISELIKDKTYADKVADENFSFLRTNAAYKRCMDIAHKKWKWVEKRLK